MITNGYFLIADITGYTAFMTQSELDHAQDILNSLFRTLVNHINPPVKISNFQGDAILMYVPEGSFIRAQTLLEIIEKLYFEFSRHLEHMQIHTTCTCKACANLPGLDLKFFLHYGSYVVQVIAGREELSGTDVIVVHRMTKNKVKETTGLGAYALITRAAVDAMDGNELCQAMIDHTETYEHIGDVSMFIHDLKANIERTRKKRQIMLAAENAWFSYEINIPLPPATAWDYFVVGRHKAVWIGMDAVTIDDEGGPRVSTGTVYHCFHGDQEFYHTIVDWNPFQYMSIRDPDWDSHWAIELHPTATGSRVVWLFEPPRTIPETGWEDFKRQLSLSKGKAENLIESELAAGKVKSILTSDKEQITIPESPQIWALHPDETSEK